MRPAIGAVRPLRRSVAKAHNRRSDHAIQARLMSLAAVPSNDDVVLRTRMPRAARRDPPPGLIPARSPNVPQWTASIASSSSSYSWPTVPVIASSIPPTRAAGVRRVRETWRKRPAPRERSRRRGPSRRSPDDPRYRSFVNPPEVDQRGRKLSRPLLTTAPFPTTIPAGGDYALQTTDPRWRKYALRRKIMRPELLPVARASN
jgi:hypothetical protein